MAVRDVAHVEDRDADLHRGGRRHGRGTAAGVIVDRRRKPVGRGTGMLLSDEPPPDCKGGGAEDGGDGDRN
jgi:hypothetical protein